MLMDQSSTRRTRMQTNGVSLGFCEARNKSAGWVLSAPGRLFFSVSLRGFRQKSNLALVFDNEVVSLNREITSIA